MLRMEKGSHFVCQDIHIKTCSYGRLFVQNIEQSPIYPRFLVLLEWQAFCTDFIFIVCKFLHFK